MTVGIGRLPLLHCKTADMYQKGTPKTESHMLLLGEKFNLKMMRVIPVIIRANIGLYSVESHVRDLYFRTGEGL